MQKENAGPKPKDKAAMIVGGILCLVPLLLNKWTLEALFPLHVGKSLSMRGVLLLSAGGLLCLVEAQRLFRGGTLYVREKLSFLMLFGVTAFPYLYFLWLGNDFGNTSDLVYGELLSFVPYAAMIGLMPRAGILIAFVIQSVVSFVEFFYVYYYGALPGVSFLYNLIESDPSEAQGFVTDYFLSLPVFVFWAAAGVGVVVLYRLTRRLHFKFVRLFVLVFAMMLLIPMTLKTARQRIPRGNFIVKCAISFRDYRMVHEKSRQSAAEALANTPAIEYDVERPDKEVHVLIIGESADRDHMSLYGFGLKTTPRLDAMRNELYPFSNVISPFINTIPNLQTLLTFQNYESPERLMETGFLMSYLKKAGYHTVWISNQTPLGIYETLSTIMAQSCDETFFLNHNQSINQTSYDEVLFEPLAEALDADIDRQYIFIHLMGSHTPFRLRYPDEYETFDEPYPGKTERQRGILNRFHNSMLYNDYIVTHIIDAVRAKAVYSTVLYLSDHGLEVFEGRDFFGHSIEGGLEIPFVLWLSDAYKARHPDKAARLNDYLRRRYMMDDAIYSICDLLGMRFDGFDAERSIFAPEFRARKRMVHQFEYVQGRDYDSFKRK